MLRIKTLVNENIVIEKIYLISINENMASKEGCYFTSLSSEILKRAKDEFGEDEKLREKSLISIRDWIKKQPHLVSSMTKGRGKMNKPNKFIKIVIY